jgi:hypothetical protein
MKYLQSFLERNDIYTSEFLNAIFNNIKTQIKDLNDSESWRLNNDTYFFSINIRLLNIDLLIAFRKNITEIGFGKSKLGHYFILIHHNQENLYDNFLDYEYGIKHELVHLIDTLKSDDKLPNTYDFYKKDIKKYHNHYVEINAYLTQGINSFLNELRINPTIFNKSTDSFEDFYNLIIKYYIRADYKFSNDLDHESIKRIKKRLYDLYTKLKK